MLNYGLHRVHFANPFGVHIEEEMHALCHGFELDLAPPDFLSELVVRG